MAQGKLSLSTKIRFGICDIGGNALFTIMAFWIMYYLTDTVGLLPALAGTAVAIGKIWDAVTDPLMGYISDRTRTRWGRRRPYILAGGISVAVSLVIFFINPRLTDQNMLFAWAVGTYCLLSLAYTIINIPYSALTPELTKDYNERTSLNGFRMTFAMIGTFIGAGLFQPLLGVFPQDKNTGYFFTGAVMGAIILVVSLITFFGIKEPPVIEKSDKTGLLKSYLSALKNKAFILILLPWVFYITAQTVVSGSLIYYLKYIYNAESLFTLGLVLLLGTAMLFIPLWVFISKKLGKKTTFSIGLFLMAALGIFIFFAGHKIGLGPFLGLMAVAGFSISPTYVLPWAIVPDAIEVDAVQSGVRKEGVYYGLWTFMSKVGQAFASAMIGWILAAFAYVQNAPVQPESAVFGIRLLMGPAMSLFYALGGVVVLFFPINEKNYQELISKAKEGK